ncbi:MAG: ATP-binding protein [Actinomycetota bacterium]|nr:ATP-binding protein [Actinomycetota bacterium]
MTGRAHRARAELTLALDSSLGLRHVPLRPDPLSAFARAFGHVRADLGEEAEVLVDLMPVTPGQRHRRLRRVMAAERQRGSMWADLVEALGGNVRVSQRTRRAGGAMELAADARRRLSKLASTEPLFALQVLVWASSEIPGRAEAQLHALIACFEQFADQNHLRVAGRSLGVVHLGADLPWRRRRFDRRARTGLFRPASEALVTASEVAGLLKPPTVHCRAPNVVRSGGVIPPPPHNLPTYRRQASLLPIGVVADDEGDRPVGLPLDETLFTTAFGRSGFGKTEGAVVQCVALARSGRGVMFHDPHGDALERLAPYLADQAERVLEINLSRGGDQLQAGWNPLSMEGLGPADVESKVQTVAAAFAASMDWSDRNTRALNIVSQATQSLCELALRLPPELAPTIFQITTLLSDEEWRREVMPFLSRTSRSYWLTRYTKLAAEALTVITNALDRLRASRTVAALFGQPRSTFDLRAAMDTGKIVLLCPGGVGSMENLIHALFLFELHRATQSRRDQPAERRRVFHAFLDELQVADSGQASELVARMLREGRKFGLRLHAMVQQPTSLSKLVLTAMLTNRSHLCSTVVSHESATVLAKEWAGLVRPETITRLPRYHFLVAATLGGEVTPPFLVRGLSVEEAWGDVGRPEDVAAMTETIDATMRRRPIGDVLAELESLDERILEHLQGAEPDEVRGDDASADVVPLGSRGPKPDRVRWRAE